MIGSIIHLTKINISSPFFQKLPELHLDDMSLICRTFSLATLRNIFPDAASWKAPGSHHPPGGSLPASPYVHIYIGMLKFNCLLNPVKNIMNCKTNESSMYKIHRIDSFQIGCYPLCMRLLYQ